MSEVSIYYQYPRDVGAYPPGKQRPDEPRSGQPYQGKGHDRRRCGQARLDAEFPGQRPGQRNPGGDARNRQEYAVDVPAPSQKDYARDYKKRCQRQR